MPLIFPAEAIIFLVMGAFFTAAAGLGRRNQRARQRRGVVAAALLIGLTPARRLLTPRVRFTTPAGRTVEAETESAAEAGRYAVGQEIAVVYDPLDPENVDLADARPAGTGFLLLIGLLFLGIGALQVLGYLPVFERLDE
ncbi:DUF3592 domain-containing protein [Hymenobacter sp. B81]|uniref:DUF3592 domain-containing protein n=1 Tax=Hymenobacter sp. B81 TaxID=3344878 RepID=UPI0037DD886B